MSEQAQADAVNEAIADPVPEMPDAPGTSVELMRGIYEDNEDGGVWHTIAEVRELNGEDEEYLASIEGKDGLLYTEYMTALLSRAVVRVGDLDIPSGSAASAILNKLILGDRDLLYLAIMKATYGDTRDVRMACISCAAMNDVVLELDTDFPITKPDFDVQKGIDVETSKGVVTLRLPNGEDTLAAQKNSKNDAELNTVMLSRCVVWPKGKAPKDPVKWARSLKVPDRKKLIKALLEIEIGPQMEGVETQCASCGKNMPILLDWVSLLLG